MKEPDAAGLKGRRGRMGAPAARDSGADADSGATWFDGVVILAAVAAFLLLFIHFFGTRYTVRNDFATFWAVSRLMLHGQLDAVYDPPRFAAICDALFGAHPGDLTRFWPYPPNAVFLVAPLALIPSYAAYLLWCAITFAFLALAVRLFFGDARRILIMALAPSTCANIILGQTGFVAAALLVAGLALLERRPLLAGALFGLLAFKPQMGMMLPLALAASRQWRPFAAAALVAAASVVASIVAFGLEPWHRFFAATIPFELAYASQDQSYFVVKAPTVFVAARLAGLSEGGSFALQAVAVVAGAGAVVWAYWRPRGPSLQAALLLAATALASPHIHVYDLSILSVAAIVLAEGPWPRPLAFQERLVAGLAWVFPLAILILSLVHSLALSPDPYPLAALAPLLSALLLACLAGHARRSRAAA